MQRMALYDAGSQMGRLTAYALSPLDKRLKTSGKNCGMAHFELASNADKAGLVTSGRGQVFSFAGEATWAYSHIPICFGGMGFLQETGHVFSPFTCGAFERQK